MIDNVSDRRQSWSICQSKSRAESILQENIQNKLTATQKVKDHGHFDIRKQNLICKKAYLKK